MLTPHTHNTPTPYMPVPHSHTTPMPYTLTHTFTLTYHTFHTHRTVHTQTPHSHPTHSYTSHSHTTLTATHTASLSKFLQRDSSPPASGGGNGRGTRAAQGRGTGPESSRRPARLRAGWVAGASNGQRKQGRCPAQQLQNPDLCTVWGPGTCAHGLELRCQLVHLMVTGGLYHLLQREAGDS